MKKIPRNVCWNIGDEPVEGRLVTHVRVPMSRWRWALPAPMPARWVSRLTFTALAVAVLLPAVISLVTRFVPLLVLSAAAGIAVVGYCAATIARARLRREAWSVLALLDEKSGSAGPEWDPADLDDDAIWAALDGALPLPEGD